MVALIARQMGCRPTEVLDEPAWAVRAWMDAAALERAIAERQEGARRAWD